MDKIRDGNPSKPEIIGRCLHFLSIAMLCSIKNGFEFHTNSSIFGRTFVTFVEIPVSYCWNSQLILCLL